MRGHGGSDVEIETMRWMENETYRVVLRIAHRGDVSENDGMGIAKCRRIDWLDTV